MAVNPLCKKELQAAIACALASLDEYMTLDIAKGDWETNERFENAQSAYDNLGTIQTALEDVDQIEVTNNEN